MSEWQFIEQLKQMLPEHPLLRIGLGDDTAVMASHPQELLIATDTILEGSHFDLKTASPREIGHKAVAVNLSDIAAMGGIAEGITIALTVGPQQNQSFLSELYDGIVAICQKYQLAIVGGDTTAWKGPLAITVTVFGRPHPLRQPILRSGAKAGDLIIVTGPLGDSLASGRHLRFEPRLDEARKICDILQPHSMIDLSDGLATDLAHICRLSGLAAELDPMAIPLADSLKDLPLEQALERALGDGEDFELCLTISPEDQFRLLSLPFPTYCIGRMVAGSGLRWMDGRSISTQGFEHQFQK